MEIQGDTLTISMCRMGCLVVTFCVTKCVTTTVNKVNTFLIKWQGVPPELIQNN